VNWSPDNDLLEHTLALGEELAAQLAAAGPAAARDDDDARDDLLLFLEVVGTLHFLGEAALAKPWRLRLAAFGADAIQAALDRWIPEELDAAADGLVELREPLERAAAPADARDPDELEGDRDGALFAQVVEALRPRDRVELVRAGARWWLDREPKLASEARELVEVFDETARANLFLTVGMNARRRDRLMWIRPDLQAPFWWWARGCALPEDALGSLFTAVEVIREFPEAGKFFDELRATASGLDAWIARRAAAGAAAAEISLRERLRPPPKQAAPAPEKRSDADLSPIHMAAAGSSVVMLWHTLYKDDYVLVQSFDHFLRVNLKKPVLEGDPNPFAHLPTAYIEVPGAPMRLRPVKAESGRTAVFDLDDPAFDAPAALLHVQCADRQLKLRLHELAGPRP